MSERRRRLAVDLLYFTGRRGGTETYLKALAPRIAALRPEIEWVGLTNTSAAESVAQWFPGEIRPIGVDGDNRPLWAVAETFRVDRVAAQAAADLVWCPANFGPRASRVPTLVTLHDMIDTDFPNPEVSRVAQRVTSLLIRRAALSASLIVTGSDDAAASITRVLGIPRERMRVVPHGSADVVDVADPAAELAAISVPHDRPLVLSTGNRMPHKNFAGLLRAMAAIPAADRPLLAITGSHGDDPLAPLVTELGLDDDVRLLGWVTRAQLESLFSVAAAYVCPSLAEGFGLPVVDAMKRGVPVVASDIPVLREVGGDDAVYADARDPHALAAAVRAVLTDAALRDRLRDAGRARAERYSWDAAAALTAQAIDEALATHR